MIPDEGGTKPGLHHLDLCPQAQLKLDRNNLFEVPQRLVGEGGPDSAEHRQFQAWLEYADQLVANGEVELERITEFWRALGSDYLSGSLQGHALARPCGYAGDFQMMDKIYDRLVSRDPRFRKWDLFFQAQAAPRAVRNRVSYFTTLMDDLVGSARRRVRVLDLACGPARHLAPWLLDNPDAPVEVTCVDLDAAALARAREVCCAANGRVVFEQANALKYQPVGEFDLIWSAGLFDYFSDATFSRTALRLLASLSTEGALVVGNFAPDNPSRAYMELVGNWKLRYRSGAELMRIATTAGVDPRAIAMGRDPTGINLFLHVRPSLRGAAAPTTVPLAFNG